LITVDQCGLTPASLAIFAEDDHPIVIALSQPGSTVSAIVGTSGSTSERTRVVTASIRNLSLLPIATRGGDVIVDSSGDDVSDRVSGILVLDFKRVDSTITRWSHQLALRTLDGRAVESARREMSFSAQV